jgi:hypothetical protein
MSNDRKSNSLKIIQKQYAAIKNYCGRISMVEATY